MDTFRYIINYNPKITIFLIRTILFNTKKKETIWLVAGAVFFFYKIVNS